MPCRDYQEDWGNNNYDLQEKVDNLAAMLCFSCDLLESNNIQFHKYKHPQANNLSEWWENYKESDRLAAIAEKEAIERKKAFSKLMDKLSPSEIDIINDLAGTNLL